MANSDVPNQPDDEFTSWDFPYVEEAQAEDDGKTNALNRRSDWKYEPPEEVEEILPPTAEEIEAIRAAAYEDGFEQGKAEGLSTGLDEGRSQGQEEGYQAGLEQGKTEGLSSGEEESKQLIDVWKELIDRLHNPVKQIESELETELLNLAVSLARSVIRAEIVTNSDIIFQALSEGLKVLPIQEKAYQIHLHPNDIDLIKQHFQPEEIEQHHWVFVEAPQMTRGGCDITTISNAVDVSIERRCRDVLDKFLLDQGLSQVDK